MRIIRDGKIVQDDWTHLDEDAPFAPGIQASVSLKRWLSQRESLIQSAPGTLGLRVHGDDALEGFAADLAHFALIAIEIPSMRDGRCFSLARLLRGRYGFAGEIRVRGDFIRDQLFFLSRVGVNAFEFAEEGDLQDALPALAEFSVKYQASADEPTPLYQRRG